MEIYEARNGQLTPITISMEVNNEVIKEESDTGTTLTKFEEDILKRVLRRECNRSISVGSILNKGNSNKYISYARMQFVYELRKYNITYNRIGNILNRDHSSAIYLYKTYLLKKS